MNESYLAKEWSVLQNQYDSYEKFSLVIKLFSIGLISFSYFLHHMGLLTLLLLLVLWLQDAIWKTFQSRINLRILEVERGLAENSGDGGPGIKAFQYNRDYAFTRPGFFGLIREYLKHAFRPTIAYPHALLVGLMVLYFLN